MIRAYVRTCLGCALLASACTSAPPAAPRDASVDVDATRGPTTPPPQCATSFCTAPLPSPGVALATGDFDGDGRVDLALGDVGPRLRDLGPLVLLRNLGGMRFEDVSRAAGVDGVGAWSLSFGDVDHDGDQDLVVSGRRLTEPVSENGRLMFFENRGGRFVEDPSRIPAGGEGVALAVHLVDLDGDARSDIVAGQSGTDPELEYLDRVLLAQPDGRYAESPPVAAQGFTWAILPTHLDDDGRVDLLVANDPAAIGEAPPGTDWGTPCDASRALRTQRVVSWWQSGAFVQRDGPRGPRFERRMVHPLLDQGRNLTPMGVAAIDMNEDGRLDYYLTGIDEPALFFGSVDGPFTEFAAPLGLHVWSRARELDFAVGWSALFYDLDRDSLEDLFVTLGTIPPSEPAKPNALHMNRGLRFDTPDPARTGLAHAGSWSSLAWADFDADGDVDLVLGAQGAHRRVCDATRQPALLARNDTRNEGRHALRVRLVGTVSDADAIGARVEVPRGATVMLREVTRGGATMSSSDPVVDFGLGERTRVAEVRVRWPDGYRQVLRDVPADAPLTITEDRWLSTTPADGRARGPVTVTVRDLGDLTPAAALSGDARWTAPFARTASDPRVWTGTFTGTGAVSLTITAPQPGGSIRAVRRFLFGL